MEDKHQDMVFSNNGNASSGAVDSYLYWWTATGFSSAKRTGLPTNRAMGNLVADFNADGNLDIAFTTTAATATIYYGSKSGYVPAGASTIPTHKAGFSVATDPGSVHGRLPIQTFTSRILDSGSAALTYTVLKYEARVPKKTSLRLQVRSAKTAAALASSTWYGPTSTSDHYALPVAGTANPKVNSTGSFTLNTVNKGHRYIQYRATFQHDYSNTPVLDKVQIMYH